MGRRGRSLRFLLLVLTIIGASAFIARAADAAPPSPPQQIVFGVDRALLGDGEFRLLTDEGKPAGKGSLDIKAAGNVPGYAQSFSAVLTLHLHGGTVTMTTPPARPDGFTSCAFSWMEGMFGDSGVAGYNCGGPITSAKGIYAGRIGTVTYDWFYTVKTVNGVTGLTWDQTPRMTIDFS